MTQEERFNAVMDEVEKVDNGDVRYRDSWISRLDGVYEAPTEEIEK